MRLNTLVKSLPLSLALFFPAFADAPLEKSKITLPTPAVAEITVDKIKLTNYWVRSGNKDQNTAAYMTIDNPSLTKDKLLKVECTDTNFTELHDHINEGGIMKMRPVEAIIVETPTVELKPGSLHIMLMGLKKELKAGETVKMRLTFEKAGTAEVDFPVRQPTKQAKRS